MKCFFAAIILGGFISNAYAQGKDSTDVDTAKKAKKVSVEVKLGSDNDSKEKKSSRFSAGFTLARFDIGLSRYLDHGSFTLSPENDFLEFESVKTHNIGFELLQMGYRFNSNFKIYLAAGIDWTHIRLKKNITFQKDQSVLTYQTEDIDFKKNRLSSQYLRIPLSFQFRTNDDEHGKKFYFVAGPEIGILLSGKQKQISDERGKVKVKDDFNFEPFRYGGFVRFGYANFGLYTKYYLSDVFAKNQGPQDFKNISFGLTFGF
jgi:hypothetical protein